MQISLAFKSFCLESSVGVIDELCFRNAETVLVVDETLKEADSNGEETKKVGSP